MNARILNSPYPEIPVGTVGQIVGRDATGYAIRVRGTFTIPGATPTREEGERTVRFESHEAEEIPELPTPAGPEILFLQSLEWLANESHTNAVEKGFWDMRHALVKAAAVVSPELAKFAVKCVDSQLRELTISELSEACEADRKNLMDDKIPHFTGVEAEVADALIRLGDYIAARKLRVGPALLAKLRYNSKREKFHGKQF